MLGWVTKHQNCASCSESTTRIVLKGKRKRSIQIEASVSKESDEFPNLIGNRSVILFLFISQTFLLKAFQLLNDPNTSAHPNEKDNESRHDRRHYELRYNISLKWFEHLEMEQVQSTSFNRFQDVNQNSLFERNDCEITLFLLIWSNFISGILSVDL